VIHGEPCRAGPKRWCQRSSDSASVPLLSCARAAASDTERGQRPSPLQRERGQHEHVAPVPVFLRAPCQAPQLERWCEAASIHPTSRWHHRRTPARARIAVNRAVPPRESRGAGDRGARRKTGTGATCATGLVEARCVRTQPTLRPKSLPGRAIGAAGAEATSDASASTGCGAAMKCPCAYCTPSSAS